jgi:hypothetical protein
MCGSEGHDFQSCRKARLGVAGISPYGPAVPLPEKLRVPAGQSWSCQSHSLRQQTLIVGRFNGTTGLTKERVFVAAGKNLFQPLSFENQPSPGRMGHLLSDLEPLSSDQQRYSNTDRWQTRRRPALSEKTRVDHPFSYLAKEYLDSVLPVCWNLTVNVRRNRGRRNIVGPAF